VTPADRPAVAADDVAADLRAMRARSEALYARACTVIPSGTVSRARILSPVPFYTARAYGSRLVDIDGNEYVDCAMGFGFNLLGHAHPVVVDAVRQAVEDGIGYGTPHPREVELARLLVDAIPCADKVTFCNSGSEATLNAVRIARAATGKPGIAKFEGGYHGWYDAVLGSVGFDPDAAGSIEDPQFVGHSIGVPPENLAHTYVLPFNHPAAFDKIWRLRDELAVVMVEGIQGAGGAIPARREFLRELRDVCTRANVLLLVDEIVTGFRLARGGAQEYFGVTADLATYSKALGGGLPFGIIAGRDPVMSILGSTGDAARDLRERVYYGGTFNGCVPATAVAIAVLTYLNEHPDVYDRLNQMGKTLRDGLARMAAANGHPVTVVGDGSLFMMRFVTADVQSVRELEGENRQAYRDLFPRLARHGVFLPTTHFGVLSAAHTDDDIARIVAAHEAALAELRAVGRLRPISRQAG
jgi:glutamate-1-semialdehyde 2,1-aminomutase